MDGEGKEKIDSRNIFFLFFGRTAQRDLMCQSFRQRFVGILSEVITFERRFSLK